MWLLKKVDGLGGKLNARREFPRFREYFCPGTVRLDRSVSVRQSWHTLDWLFLFNQRRNSGKPG
jgi:hypothetical protein